jgi:hypothetical protein
MLLIRSIVRPEAIPFLRQAEYAELYAGIVEHYQPVSWYEEDLVDQIAAWSWRLRRPIRCESGLITRALAEHSYELRQ